MATFKQKIMVVDDEKEARTALARVLSSKGYEVLEVGEGKPVFSLAKSKWPSLIVLDIVLPDISGIEVLKQLRADPITKAIPVLLLTAKPDVVEQLGTLKEKTDEYFEKPGRIEDLMSTIQRMVAGGTR